MKIDGVLVHDKEALRSHVENYFRNLFEKSSSVVEDFPLVDHCIPNLINEEINDILTRTPNFMEIKVVVFNMNRDGAPGPDDFGAFFFQAYWDIIKKEAMDVLIHFFHSSWIFPNFNSNILILLPKDKNVDSIDMFRAVSLAKFKFKIISKIFVDMLVDVMSVISSKEQRGFVKRINIRDCIGLTSEAINLMEKKSFCGNLALKVDISKSFDTLD